MELQACSSINEDHNEPSIFFVQDRTSVLPSQTVPLGVELLSRPILTPKKSPVEIPWQPGSGLGSPDIGIMRLGCFEEVSKRARRVYHFHILPLQQSPEEHFLP